MACTHDVSKQNRRAWKIDGDMARVIPILFAWCQVRVFRFIAEWHTISRAQLQFDMKIAHQSISFKLI